MLYEQPLVTINSKWEKALSCTTQYLERHDFKVVCSFYIQMDFPVNINCSCPNHQTEECNCSMAVLLLYSTKKPPVTLLVHGHEEHVSFFLSDSQQQYPDAETAERMKSLMKSEEFIKFSAEVFDGAH